MKTQEEKSEAHIALQPKNMEKNTVQLIMAFDLCGWKMGDIAREIGITQSRVSIIVGSPLYKAEKARRFEELKSKVVEKKSDSIVKGDPVAESFRDEALNMAKAKLDIARNGKSESVKSAAITECLAFAGYMPQQKKTSVSVMVSEKVAGRFERILGMKIETTTITNTNEGVTPNNA